MSRSEAFYLESARGMTSLALFDRPEIASSLPGVLICPPWGWDEIASYRSRRDWGKRFADAGHPALRLDLPGAGDSDGGPATEGLLTLWIEAIRTGVEWLRAEAGNRRIALLGIGLGGLLAQEALDRGIRAEELICWGAPPSGRHFVREARAFAAMKADRSVERDLADPLASDWLEAGGFVLSAATLSELKALRPTGFLGVRRALLIGRDGVADSAGAERLGDAGVAVTEDPGIGWGTFVGHPETTELPSGVAEAVEEWLAHARAEVSGIARDTQRESASRSAHLCLGEGLRTFSEVPTRVREGFGEAFGVLVRPRRRDKADYCTVFLNPGAVRHVGPNRMWVEAARELGASGVPSLRLDLESIGEADGDPARRAHVSDFYDEAFVGELIAVLDFLEREGVARRFRLVGLCAGAFWAFRTALVDDRVESAVLINAGALLWHAGILDEREGRRAGRVFRRHWWGRLLRGEIAWSKLPRLASEVVLGALRSALRTVRPRTASGRSAIVSELDRLPPGKRVLLAFSDAEPLHEELLAHGILDRVGDWPGIEVVDLPGADHTLRSVAAQRAVAALLRREVGGDSAAQSVGSAGRQR